MKIEDKKLKLKGNYKLAQNSSLIVAMVIVSESELVKVIKDYNSDYENTNPIEFQNVLFNMGMDIRQPYRRQDGMYHRNRLNEIVLCSRWIGEERQDKSWIMSGYASKEAIDKYSGSKILEDLYRSKNMTKDAQEHLEDRDKYSVIDETQWKD